jgi:pyruvate/2-oxoglutarate dehydrogenase complex dihydrolipoamide dehydrogenase (E3) component
MYDVIIVGTGQATGMIVGELLKADRRVAIVEEDRVGGTCVNWGCTPTKTLVASMRAARMVQRAPEFGIDTSAGITNFSRVMERVNAIRNDSSSGFRSWLEKGYRLLFRIRAIY